MMQLLHLHVNILVVDAISFVSFSALPDKTLLESISITTLVAFTENGINKQIKKIKIYFFILNNIKKEKIYNYFFFDFKYFVKVILVISFILTINIKQNNKSKQSNILLTKLK